MGQFLERRELLLLCSEWGWVTTRCWITSNLCFLLLFAHLPVLLPLGIWHGTCPSSGKMLSLGVQHGRCGWVLKLMFKLLISLCVWRRKLPDEIVCWENTFSILVPTWMHPMHLHVLLLVFFISGRRGFVQFWRIVLYNKVIWKYPKQFEMEFSKALVWLFL